MPNWAKEDHLFRGDQAANQEFARSRADAMFCASLFQPSRCWGSFSCYAAGLI